MSSFFIPVGDWDNEMKLEFNYFPKKTKQMDDNESVLVVTTNDGYLVHAGKPETFKKNLIAEYATQGYQIKTVTIEEFRKRGWIWYWEKEKGL